MKSYVVSILSLFLSLGVCGQNYSPEWFRSPRTPPLTTIKTARTIDVTKYGAIPDDGLDDYKAIVRALSELKSNSGNATLIFPKGRYDVVLPKESKATHCFNISDCRNFEIVSPGAEIIIDNPTVALLKVERCSNAIIKGLRVDYSVLPYTQGVVLSVDKQTNSFRFELERGFDSPLAPHLMQAPTRWGSLLEKCEDGIIRLRRGVNNLVPVRDGIVKIEESVFEVKTSAMVASQVKQGDMFVLIGRYNGRPTFSFNHCNNITLRDNILYAGPAGGFGLRESSSMALVECKILRKHGRYISQNADCVHTLAAHIGPWIEGCVFEGQMDDAINLKTELIRIIRTVDDKTYQLTIAPKVGDVLTMFNPREGVMMGRAKVISVERVDNMIIVGLNEELPEPIIKGEKDSDMFFNDSKSNESFVIRNNVFRDFRRFGMLIQATHGTIEGNTLSGLSTRAITLQNSAAWPEGFVPYNIRILSNRISNCGFDNAYINEGEHASPILISTNTYNGTPAKWRGAHNIVVSSNSIESNSAHAIMLSGVHDCVVENNKTTQKSTVPVYLENYNNITLK